MDQTPEQVETSARLIRLTDDVRQLSVKVDNLDGRLSILEGRGANLGGQVTSLQGQVTTLQGQVTSLQGQVTGLQGQLARIDIQLARAEVYSETTRGDIRKLQDDHRDLGKALQAIRTVDFRLMYGTMFGLAVGMTGLMAKGFGWL
ncbi:MAG: hypothetical protein ABIT83_08370 [Massilia sp.]